MCCTKQLSMLITEFWQSYKGQFVALKHKTINASMVCNCRTLRSAYFLHIERSFSKLKLTETKTG